MKLLRSKTCVSTFLYFRLFFITIFSYLFFSTLTYADGLKDEDEPMIVVSASRNEQLLTDALPHTTVINRNEIDQSPVSDLMSLLKMQGGLSVTQSGVQGALSGVRIRGGETRHTLILIDGVPLNNLSSGTAALEQIPLSLVERVEIVRGNVSALYGSQAVGGLVQVFTRQPSGQDAFIRVAGGTGSQVQASIQVRGGNEKVQATFGISHEELKVVSAQNPEQFRTLGAYGESKTMVNPDKDGYVNDSANGHIRYRPNEKNEFGMRFFNSYGKNFYDNEFSLSPHSIQYNKTQLQNISVYANNQLTENWQSVVQLSQLTDSSDDFDSDPSFGSGFSHFKNRTKEVSWQNNIHSNIGEWIFGAAFSNKKLESTVDYDGVKRNNSSFFGGYSLDKGRHHLQLNVRHDEITGLDGALTGAFNYAFELSDEWKVLAGYSNGFSAPNFNELYYPGYSNPNLKSEHATYSQLGAQYAVDSFGARMTLFESRYKDKISLDSETYLPINIAQATSRGAEWHGWYNHHGWTIDSNLTYQEVKDRVSGKYLLRQPRLLASIGVGKSWGRWGARLNWQVQSGVNDVAESKIAGYGVVNAAVSYAMTKKARISLNMGNLFNRNYQTLYGYNSMPRNALLSFQYQPSW